MKLLKATSYFFLTLLLLEFAVADVAAADKHKPYEIVCTTGMIYDLARNVAGDRASVRSLIGSGIDPHLYKPTRSDIGILSKADVVFYNGLMLEGKMTDALIRVAQAGRAVHAVTEALDEKYLLEPESFNGHFDPHVWMDPQAWSKALDVVRDKLSEYDPDGKESYFKNALEMKKQIEELDAYAKKVLVSVPESSRVLVTAHDAFNYFGRRYDYEVVGIQGISTDSEAGVKDIERIVSLIVERLIKAVFIESTVSRKNVQALIEGVQSRGKSIAIGGELFSDAMGVSGTYKGTYIGMIDHNVTTISRALGGAAPLAGMQGKLKAGKE